MDPLLATILLWPVAFEPRGWAYCAGQLLAISTNTALFSLLGTIYGGNGSTNFALPDLRGRVPVGAGQGVNLSIYELGQKGGSENVTLIAGQMPTHAHSITISASNAQASDSIPTSAINTLAAPYDTTNFSAIAGYNNLAPNTQLNVGGNLTGTVGNNLPTPILQPYLGLNYIIATEGVFPTRN